LRRFFVTSRAPGRISRHFHEPRAGILGCVKRRDILGRRIKTEIAIRSDSAVTLTSIGRGKAPFHWLDRIQGKKAMRVIDRE